MSRFRSAVAVIALTLVFATSAAYAQTRPALGPVQVTPSGGSYFLPLHVRCPSGPTRSSKAEDRAAEATFLASPKLICGTPRSATEPWAQATNRVEATVEPATVDGVRQSASRWSSGKITFRFSARADVGSDLKAAAYSTYFNSGEGEAESRWHVENTGKVASFIKVKCSRKARVDLAGVGASAIFEGRIMVLLPGAPFEFLEPEVGGVPCGAFTDQENSVETTRLGVICFGPGVVAIFSLAGVAHARALGFNSQDSHAYADGELAVEIEAVPPRPDGADHCNAPRGVVNVYSFQPLQGP